MDGSPWSHPDLWKASAFLARLSHVCPGSLAPDQPTAVRGRRASPGHEGRIPFLQWPAVRPVGRQPVPGDGRLHVRVPDGPSRRVPLAVVFRRAVLPADRLRRQRQRLPDVGMDGRSPEGLVMVCPRPVAVLPAAAAAAAGTAGGMVPGAVDGDQRMAAGHRPPLQHLSALQRRVDAREAAAEVPGAGPVQPLAHPGVRRRPPRAEERAEAPRHHRITAAPDLPAGPRQRRHPGREHRGARHQAVGKADATRGCHACRPGRRRGGGMRTPHEAYQASTDAFGRSSLTFSCPAFACLSAGWPIRCGKSTKENSRCPRNRLIMKEKNSWRELLRIKRRGGEMEDQFPRSGSLWVGPIRPNVELSE